jgi:3-phenylpropionate/trans-cinnamate dioxygenase ferredoxin reductase subunit
MPGEKSSGTLVVGASQAGVQLAVSLRELNSDEPITLVGAEERPPYQRPPLSKAFLAGKAGEDTLELRAPDFYPESNLRLICAERVTRLSMSAGGGGEAVTDRGRTLRFEHLALTVGAAPRRISVPGHDLDGVCYLRDAADAIDLRRRLASASEVVIIGGGFIGLEAAAVARAQGKNVTVVEAAERLIARSVAPVVSDFYLRAHLRRGTGVRLGVEVLAINATAGRLSDVELSDGTRVPADIVLVGVGAIPRTELAEQIGLDCRGGIVVDEFARTSDPSVVAAGDCAIGPNPLTGEGLFRLESVQNAVSQARVAAATIAGRPEPYTAVPWFWSDQDTLKLQIAGLTAGYDEYVVRGDPDGERFAVLYYRDGQLLGIDAVNRPPDYLVVRRALSTGANIPADLAVDSNVALKEIVIDPVQVSS